MTYLESAEDISISQERAFAEIRAHGLATEISDFLIEVGDFPEYSATDVLHWLGY